MWELFLISRPFSMSEWTNPFCQLSSITLFWMNASGMDITDIIFNSISSWLIKWCQTLSAQRFDTSRTLQQIFAPVLVDNFQTWFSSRTFYSLGRKYLAWNYLDRAAFLSAVPMLQTPGWRGSLLLFTAAYSPAFCITAFWVKLGEPETGCFAAPYPSFLNPQWQATTGRSAPILLTLLGDWFNTSESITMFLNSGETGILYHLA